MGYLTDEEYQVMLVAQDYRCYICRKKSPRRRFDQDHDHELAKMGIVVVRGLLCRRCNEGLGRFEYSEEVLKNAIKYMQKIIKLRKQYQKENSVG